MARAFIQQAFRHQPPLTTDIFTDVVKEIKAGKSGACVYELTNNRILKTYLPREHNWVFNSGSKPPKNYIRAIRDIVMTMILPDSMSPVVHNYGFFKSNRGLQPFLIMEKVLGTELFDFEPTGTDKDLRVLKNVVKALLDFNKSIRSYNPKVEPCHKDLHPRNILVDPCTNKVKLIDFDMSTCPFDLLRTNETTHRYTNLLLDKLVGNSIRVTKSYTHEHLHNTPPHIREDADLYQLYSVFYYFSHHNERLTKLMGALGRTSNKDEFMNTSAQVLNKLLQKRVLKL